MSPHFRAHPEFGYFCLSQSFRRKARKALLSTVAVGVVAGGFVLWARDDPHEGALTIVSVNEAPASADTMSTVVRAGSATTAERLDPPASSKATCDGDNWTLVDGKCVVRRTHKAGSLASATEGPQIAAVPANPSIAAVAGRSSAGTQARQCGSRRKGDGDGGGVSRAGRAAAPHSESGATDATQPDCRPRPGQSEYRITRRPIAGRSAERSRLRVIRRQASADAGAEVGDEMGEAVAGLYRGRPLPSRRAAHARIPFRRHLKRAPP